MKHPIPIGAVGELTFTVEAAHTIAFDPVPPVLSTPSLIWFLEHAAVEALKPVLEEGEISLGGEINVQHLAPTLEGRPVTCTARLISAEGPTFLFQVQAREDGEVIARGSHRRVVVRATAFAKRLARKAG
jgi:fluoroacetyl-CoA thioesterase